MRFPGSGYGVPHRSDFVGRRRLPHSAKQLFVQFQALNIESRSGMLLNRLSLFAYTFHCRSVLSKMICRAPAADA
jgi:hypothetical protein